MRVAVAAGPQAMALSAAGLAEVSGIALHCIEPAAEPRLREVLAQSPWHCVVLSVHLAARGASYATVDLQGSDGRPRAVNAQLMAQMLALARPQVVVLSSAAPSAAIDAVAQLWAAATGACIVAMPADRSALASLLRTMAGAGPNELAAAALQHVQCAVNAGALRFFGQPMLAASAQAPEPAAAPTPPAAAEIHPIDRSAQALRAKREANRFDVFLCHNSADKPTVKRIGEQLKQRGILPWLDEWELPPGQPWQALLEQRIGNIRSAAVCIGTSGISPWHQQEMRGFIAEFVERQVPVIPVLLPDAPHQPELPLFLRQMTWVDFRRSDPDPMDRLIWGITGQRPEEVGSL